MSLHVITHGEWDATCNGMKSGITCKCSWSVTAYEGKKAWYAMTWKGVVARFDGGWNETSLKNKKNKQEKKTKWNQHSFKHVNKQVHKSEFGIWEKTASIKMNVFNIFKEKMHFSCHLFQQMWSMKQECAWNQ